MELRVKAGTPRIAPIRAPRHGGWPTRATTQDTVLSRVKLGRSDLNVSEVCLGCMMFGSQNTEKEAHEILSAATDMGVNFLDTSEGYPIPPREATIGRSTTYVGNWLRKSNVKREDLVIATKVAGFAKEESVGFIAAARTDPPSKRTDLRLDAKSIEAAVDCELRRLGIDCIDLMQTHWPDRYVPTFGSVTYDPEKERESVPFDEQVMTMAKMIEKGKIRHWGLSNESSYGTTMICLTADALNCPRPVSIQNSYSLIDRRFETELAEVCSQRHFGLPLLPWSPAAGGVLSGKYLNGDCPEGTRMSTLSWRYQRFLKGRMFKATEAYVKIAEEFGVSPIQLAYVFCKSRSFVASTIIGATSLAQLEEDIVAFGQELPEEALKAIDQVHAQNPNPEANY